MPPCKLGPWVGLLVAVATLPLAGGCIGGSLATSTGPRVSGDWSVARHQAAHVGEVVRFSFVLTKPFENHPVRPAGLAQYCVITLDGRAVEAVIDPGGKFTATYKMPAEWAGKEIMVTGTAYRQYGGRDIIVIDGETVTADGGVSSTDKAVARSKVKMLVYQSRVEIPLTAGADDFNFRTGRLALRRNDGTMSSVGMYRPPLEGFTVSGPDQERGYTVVYEPTWKQVNSIGPTEAEFTVYDLAGHQHRHTVEVKTP